eukprot:442635-Prymnesium_polylepis.1
MTQIGETTQRSHCRDRHPRNARSPGHKYPSHPHQGPYSHVPVKQWPHALCAGARTHSRRRVSPHGVQGVRRRRCQRSWLARSPQSPPQKNTAPLRGVEGAP